LKYYLAIAVIAGMFGVYGTDHGIYLGTEYSRANPPAWRPSDPAYVIKRCRYLFITGVSVIKAADFVADGVPPPYKSYCTLFPK